MISCERRIRVIDFYSELSIVHRMCYNKFTIYEWHTIANVSRQTSVQDESSIYPQSARSSACVALLTSMGLGQFTPVENLAQFIVQIYPFPW